VEGVVAHQRNDPADLGIAHTIDVDPRTGAAAIRVPVPTPDGRAGFGPQFALEYSPGTGNSPYGWGWSLTGCAPVTVSTLDGVPRYDGGDGFAFAGMRLLPALEPAPGGKWRHRVSVRASHDVQYFRPQDDSDAARFERWVDRATGDVHWRVRDRHNTLTVYGRSPGSRIADPDAPEHVFAWLPEASYDGFGNAIRYDYAAEDLASVDLAAPYERGQLARTQLQRYLVGVRYGNTLPVAPDIPDPVGNRWCFRVALDYGDHTIDPPGPEADTPWPARPDAYSTAHAGFLVRTWRLLRRVLVFHDLPELGPGPTLVATLTLEHDLDPAGSMLMSVTRTGHRRDDAAGAALPPLRFTYSRPRVAAEPQTVDATDLENAPFGFAGQRHQLLDLYGEGLPAVVTNAGGAWYVKRNLGGGRFGPLERLDTRPTHPTSAYFVGDFDRNGDTDLVSLRSRVAGATTFARASARWQAFHPFATAPQLDGAAWRAEWLDADGDGRPDVVLAGTTTLTWYPVRGAVGFAAPRQAPRFEGDFAAPPVAEDPETFHFLADMTGDGLADQVRIGNGCAEYWPALGNGMFGPRVTMDDAPVLAPDAALDPSRLRLLDLDGSGTTDLLYLGQGELRWWTNAAGNRFVPGGRVSGLPYLDAASTVQVLDLLGTGVPCLVWSVPRAGGPTPVSYLPLSDTLPPRLVTAVDNSTGGRIELHYSSSAQHYLRDREAGQPWATLLPVHPYVVDAMESIDLVGGARTSVRYAYHDGYFDGGEQAFRGFALVDRFDATSLPGIDDPPVSCTRMWFHTGAPDWHRTLGHRYAGDAQLPILPAVTVTDPGTLDADDYEDALRAAIGHQVREETYAVGADGTLAPHPFAVTQTRRVVRRVQPAAASRPGERRRAAFELHVAERMTHDYEQQPGDPRVAHHLTLDVDRYGEVLLACDIAYPRRPGLIALPEQAETLVTAHRYRVATVDEPDRFEVGIPVEGEEFELSGLRPGVPLGFAAARADVDAALAAPLAPDQPLPAGVPAGRRISWERSYYWDDDRTAALPLGAVGTRTLLHHEEAGALSDGLVAAVYGGRVDADMLAGAGYVRRDGYWWQPDPVQHVADAAGFFQLARTERWDGAVTTVEWDPNQLAQLATVDALGNRTAGDIDYHLLEPWRVTDPNGAVTETRYDPLGVAVVTTAYAQVRAPDGTVQPHGHDPLAASPPLPAATVAQVLADPAPHLQRAARLVHYDLGCWARDGTPPTIVALDAEELLHDGRDGGAPGRVRTSVAYLDGFGREVQSKVRVEPGPAVQRDANGHVVIDAAGLPVLANAEQRWLVTGHVVYDAKQQPVRRYEPFFSPTPAYEPDAELAQFGVMHRTTYDQLGRVVREDSPLGVHTRVEYEAWWVTQHDENDTVQDSLYRVTREALPDGDPEKQALRKAQAHAGTPVVTDLDPLGRPGRVSDVTAAGPRSVVTRHDGRGDESELVDPRGLVTVRHRRDLLGNQLATASVDAGESLALIDAAGRLVHTWDPRGVHVSVEHDQLDRPVRTYVDDAGPRRLAEDVQYGDDPAVVDATLRHARGRVVRHRDETGVLTVEAYDPTGQPLSTARRLCADPAAEPDWAAAVALGPTMHRTVSAYDALGRVVRQSLPDGSIRHSSYLPSGGLARITVDLPDGGRLVALDDVAYNARRQRTRAVLGNGVVVEHTYHPETFATSRITATRPATAGAPARVLQDLRYTYDPVGNVTRQVDEAQQPPHPTPLLTGLTVSSHADFTYDAAYQLLEATGRVHQALLEHDHRHGAPGTFKGTRHLALNNGAAVERYRRTYTYDLSGNLTRITHLGASRSWATDVWVSPTSNRGLPAHDPSGAPVAHPETRFDAVGQCTFLPHLRALQWSWRGALQRAVVVDRSASGQPDDDELYVHDAGGQRLRKVTRRLVGGQVETTEKLYLDGGEIKRIRLGDTLVLERVTSDVGDDIGRVVLVHRWTVDTAGRETEAAPSRRDHYQLGDHIGCAVLELDGSGGVIGYEEYFPYGGSAFLAGDRQRDVAVKDYRYAGKERDDTTGFYYFGHRYYAPWIGRWLSPDPAGPVDSLNLYQYALGNPVTNTDPDGLQARTQRQPRVVNVSGIPRAYRPAWEGLTAEQRTRWRELAFFPTKSGRVVVLDPQHFPNRQEFMEQLKREIAERRHLPIGILHGTTPGAGEARAGEGGGQAESVSTFEVPEIVVPPPRRRAPPVPGTRRPRRHGEGPARGGGTGRSGRTCTGQRNRRGSRREGDAAGSGAGTGAGGDGATSGTGTRDAAGTGSGAGAQPGTGRGTAPETGGTQDAGTGGADGTGSGDTGTGPGAGQQGAGPGGGADAAAGAEASTGIRTGADRTSGAGGGRGGGTGRGRGTGTARGPGTGGTLTGPPGDRGGGSPRGSPTGVPGGEPGGSPSGEPGGVLSGGDQGQPGVGPPALGGDVNGTPNGTAPPAGSGPGGRPSTGPGTGRSMVRGAPQRGEGGPGGAPRTVLDQMMRYVGPLNLVFHDDPRGQSGGIPGGMGPFNFGPVGQALFAVALVASLLLPVGRLVFALATLVRRGVRAVIRRAAFELRRLVPAARAALGRALAASRAALTRLRGPLGSFLEWFGFRVPQGLRGRLGVTRIYRRLPGWWPRFSSKIRTYIPPGSWWYREAWAHERFHQWLARYVGIFRSLWTTKILGFPPFGAAAYLEEVGAYAFGSLAAGRIHLAAFAPLRAFGSLTAGEYLATLAAAAAVALTSDAPANTVPAGGRP
jgi:RHS repeat-associated protein